MFSHISYYRKERKHDRRGWGGAEPEKATKKQLTTARPIHPRGFAAVLVPLASILTNYEATGPNYQADQKRRPRDMVFECVLDDGSIEIFRLFFISMVSEPNDLAKQHRYYHHHPPNYPQYECICRSIQVLCRYAYLLAYHSERALEDNSDKTSLEKFRCP